MASPLDRSSTAGDSIQQGRVYTASGSLHDREPGGESTLSPLLTGRNRVLENMTNEHSGLTSPPPVCPDPFPKLSLARALLQATLQELETTPGLPQSPSQTSRDLSPDLGPLTIGSPSAGYYPNHNSPEQRTGPSVHAWRHGVTVEEEEDDDDEDVEAAGLFLRIDKVPYTTQQHHSATSSLIIAEPSTYPNASCDPSTDQPLIETSSSSFQFSSSSSSSPGRPTQLEEALGNFNEEHNKAIRENPDLLDAKKKTKGFQLEKRMVNKVGKPIAQGSYGTVYQGTLHIDIPHNSCPQSPLIDAAIKVIQVKASDYGRLVKKLYREVIPLCRLNHPNIVRIRGYVMNGRKAWIVTDWQKYGNAVDYLEKYPNADRLALIIDAVEALLHLHSHAIVHGDLKADNVLIGDDYSAKLTDFGLARILEEGQADAFMTSSTAGGCLEFFAPELYAGGARTKESDMWALGGLILQIATGLRPFHGKKRREILADLSQQRPPTLKPYGQFRYRQLLQPIIEGCWKIKPQERCTVHDISSYLRERLHNPNF